MNGSRHEEDQTSNPSDFQSHPYQAEMGPVKRQLAVSWSSSANAMVEMAECRHVMIGYAL